ncbi:S-adenosyl-L-methionine-dependent methyltransferase [Collybia nuda]|uniref:S-adenosyl-L-methionine-dependent methyltransferase n=1 Tax=Collybia nuda TaxID=64659 RepID=A0A9P6CG40_9AGAR|nr:S-adenosyl-L-methionine-dependent methyltransferase [Collybia nuda]
MPYIVYTMTQAHLATLSTLANKAEKTANRSPQEVEMTISGSPISSFFIVLVALVGILIFWMSNSYTSILIISGALWISYRLSMGSSSDPYGLFHLALNRLPGQDPTKPPLTEWLNMGFWKDTDIFPQACRALALKLIQATGCKRGDRVLDVGYGTGESLLLLLSDSLIRPSSLTGITSLPHHHHRAQDRVRRFQKSLEEPGIEVSLHAYDAIYHPTTVGHPLDPATAQFFDVILALDCAYHFNTRKMFLHQSFEKLAPGGRIGLADICFDPSIGSRAWLVSSLIRVIPKYNLTSIRNYGLDMKEVGYVDIELNDITEDVFPGFIRFLKSRGWRWAAFGTLLQWYVNSGARFVIVCGSRTL